MGNLKDVITFSESNLQLVVDLSKDGAVSLLSEKNVEDLTMTLTDEFGNS